MNVREEALMAQLAQFRDIGLNGAALDAITALRAELARVTGERDDLESHRALWGGRGDRDWWKCRAEQLSSGMRLREVTEKGLREKVQATNKRAKAFGWFAAVTSAEDEEEAHG